MVKATQINLDATGVVIRGYDPVAYFNEGRPIPGSPEFSAEHEGGTHLFANAANREAFKARPAKYTPQCGGYSADGVIHWAEYVSGWTSWNHVRTAASLAAAASLTIALCR